jgi:hypothetical protein
MVASYIQNVIYKKYMEHDYGITRKRTNYEKC